MDKLSQLERILDNTEKQEFDIVDDLKNLSLYFGVVKQKEFRKMLNRLITKYEDDELAEIRKALVKKCQAGDIQAIRLYAEHFKPTVISDDDDGLLDALTSAGKEAWKGEV